MKRGRRRAAPRCLELARRGRGVAAVERLTQRDAGGGDRTHARPRRAGAGNARAGPRHGHRRPGVRRRGACRAGGTRPRDGHLGRDGRRGGRRCRARGARQRRHARARRGGDRPRARSLGRGHLPQRTDVHARPRRRPFRRAPGAAPRRTPRAMVVWSAPERNPFHAGPLAVLRALGRTPPTDAELVRAFSLSAPGVLAGAIAAAGFRDVVVEPVPAPRRHASLAEALASQHDSAARSRDGAPGRRGARCRLGGDRAGLSRVRDALGPWRSLARRSSAADERRGSARADGWPLKLDRGRGFEHQDRGVWYRKVDRSLRWRGTLTSSIDQAGLWCESARVFGVLTSRCRAAGSC